MNNTKLEQLERELISHHTVLQKYCPTVGKSEELEVKIVRDNSAIYMLRYVWSIENRELIERQIPYPIKISAFPQCLTDAYRKWLLELLQKRREVRL